MSFDFEEVVIDDGTPLPSLGKVRMSAGAAKLREKLTGADIEHIRKAKPLDPETAGDRLSKRDVKGRLRLVALTDSQLVMLFAQLNAAGASDVAKGRIKKIIKTNWPEYSSNFLDAARNLAECEAAAARRSKQMKNEDDNITDINGFAELCGYGLKRLERANGVIRPTLFIHGSELVRVPETPQGEARIEILNQKAFNHVLNTQAPYRRTRGDSDFISDAAPKAVCEHLFSDPALPVPELEKIVTVPTFTADGDLIQMPGYHKASGLLYLPDPGLKIPVIPDDNLADAAKHSLEYLIDLFADFPFDGCSRSENVASPGASLTNFLALLLTPFVSPIIDDVVPAHLLTKPAPGTGASLLAEACQIVFDGKTDLRPPLSRNEDERRKALFTALQTQKNYLVYDNVSGEMDSATIASFLTSREWTDRILGRTGERTVRNASATVWTGINPGFSPELQRRISLIKLDAKMAKPGERGPASFKIKGSFKKHIEKHRGEIIGACLTLLKYWIAGGMKDAKSKPLASFERWHWTVGGILEKAGLTGFQQNRHELEIVTGGESNPIQILVQEWYRAACDELHPIKFKATASGDDGLLKLVQDQEIPLSLKLKRDAVSDFDFSPGSFGKFLSVNKDGTFNVKDAKGNDMAVSLSFVDRESAGNVWQLIERKPEKAAQTLPRPRCYRFMTHEERAAYANMNKEERAKLVGIARQRQNESTAT